MAKDSIRIIDDSRASAEYWEETAVACDYATFFHTPAWADVFFRYTGGRLRPAARKIVFEDGRSALIALSGREYAHGAFRQFLSASAGTFGGWISRDSLDRVHSLKLVDYLLGLKNIAWRENPYDPYLSAIDIAGSVEEFTQTIDLTPGGEKNQNAPTRAHAKALRKAVREGVTIHEAEDLSDWEEHFRIYEESLVRWEKSGTAKKRFIPYTWDLFKIIFDKNPACRKLWYARYKGSMAASVLCFYWNRHAVAWHGGAREEFFNVRPNNLLYQHLIDHARKSGFHWFDCNTPGGLQGVIEFKDNLGTQRKRSRFLDKASKGKRLVQKIRRMF
jgi:hypothetical protein